MSKLFPVLVMAFSLQNLNAADNNAEVFRAIRNGDTGWLHAHINTANIEARDGRGATPLMHAAAFGNLQTLKLLIEKGADVNARNQANASALLWCVRDPEKARLLIEKGADVNAQSKQGRTPLMIAALSQGNSSTVALLLDKGADLNAKAVIGTTALHSAAIAGEMESVRLLLAKGANVRATDFVNRTPLYFASSTGNQR
jgi:ankyrin repeat protein